MKKTQLFCIPYAGGTASFFRNVSGFLGSDMEVHLLEYAGHGNRRKESFYENLDSMLYDIANKIKTLRDAKRPYFIFGYSMGCMVTYEVVTRYFQQDTPAHIFLAAHEPPHLPFRGKDFALLNDDEFVEAMEAFGGVDERIKNNKRFWDIFLPPMRADYRYLNEYTWESGHEKLSCNVTVFYSEEDTKQKDMQQWEQHTLGEICLKRFDGNHFFLKEHEQEVASIILDLLK